MLETSTAPDRGSVMDKAVARRLLARRGAWTMPGNSGLARTILGAVLAVALAGCAVAPLVRPALPPPPPHPHGQVLWHIVHDRCVPGEIASRDPAPCASVAIADGIERGHAVLKDKVGVGQYLVMPTIPITGIEDARLLRADTPDYFAAGWRARSFVASRVGGPLGRSDVAVAVNSRYGRSQDLLHLHVDCLRLDVRDAIARIAPTLSRRWSRRPVRLAGHSYYAVRVDGNEAPAQNPFRLLYAGMRVAPADMGGWTLVLAGARFGMRDGFVLLAARVDPAAGDMASGEILQDHGCTGHAKPATNTPGD